MSVLAQAEAPALAQAVPMSDNEAQCYLERYPDLRAVFGTLEAAKKHWKEHGEREKRMKTCEGPLTDAEAQCYLDRYEDLAKLRDKSDAIGKAKAHWLEEGSKEGRHRYCAPRISDQQAQCYLDRNPKLQKAFGADNWARAKQHWYEKGSDSDKDYKCEGKQPQKCAEEGKDCACDGTIFLVRKDTDAKNPDDASAWEEGLNWKYSQGKPVNGKQSCDSAILGDPAPGKPKHCLCEAKPIKKPQKCAAEG